MVETEIYRNPKGQDEQILRSQKMYGETQRIPTLQVSKYIRGKTYEISEVW